MDERLARKPRPSAESKSVATARFGLGLEVLRIVGTFAVLLYHASLSYLATPMRLTLWHVYDARGHASMDLFAYWVNGFAMPLFFLAAGASAPAALESRGVRVFLKHRSGRLLRPLLFGFLTVLPISYLLYGYGLLVTGRISLNHISAWRFPPEVERHLYGLAHLWFLEYLFLVCVIWAGLWWLGRAVSARGWTLPSLQGWADRVLGSAWSPLGMAVPTALIFLLDTDTALRVENILIPNPSRLAHYLYFFAAGGWLARSAGAHERIERRGARDLGLAAVTFVVMSPMLLRYAAGPLSGMDRVVFAGLAAVFPWLMILGGLGFCQRYVSGKGPLLRYLGEASFWVYVIHLPIILGTQVLLIPYGWPGPLKFLLVSAVTIAVSLASYQYVARYSMVGEVINGARKRLKNPGRLGPEFGWAATLAVVLIVGVGFTWRIRTFIWADNLHTVVPGQLYRSGRLSATDFDALLREARLKTVVTFTGGGHGWLDRQQFLAKRHGATIHLVNLRDDREPSRATLAELLRLLERAPRPILVQGHRGLDHCGFAAALARLSEGATLDEALEQFSMRYAQFGGPSQSRLGGVLLDYRAWLSARGLPHTPDRFKTWTEREYHPVPSPTASIAGKPEPSVIR